MAIQQILSPLPGTFYRKPAPDQPAFKKRGRHGRRSATSIGLVEVMKSFHEVKAGRRRQDRRVPGRERGCRCMAGQPIAEIDV